MLTRGTPRIYLKNGNFIVAPKYPLGLLNQLLPQLSILYHFKSICIKHIITAASLLSKDLCKDLIKVLLRGMIRLNLSFHFLLSDFCQPTLGSSEISFCLNSYEFKWRYIF
jgi:hypothetical protein